jgi:hypothetical protein
MRSFLPARFVGCCSGAAIMALAAASSAEAAVIAYEGFDYAAGDLATQGGGTGWTAAWTKNGNGTGNVVDDSLAYTDSAGNQLAVSGGRGFFSGQTANGDYHRDLAMQGDMDGTTTWWSFVGQRLAPHPTEDENVARASSLQIRNTVTTTPSQERLAVGKGTTAPPSVTYNWGLLHTGNVANSANSTEPILEQAFLVVRIDHSGDSTVADKAWLWVNPRLDQTPDVAMADVAMTDVTSPAAIDFSFNRVRAFAGNANASGPYADFAVDEIRLGNNYVDVAPIAPSGDADFDNDSDVDGADFVIWQRGLGTGTTNGQGDADGNGVVNGADLGVWKGEFATAEPVAGAVPEPAAVALAGCVVVALGGPRRRRAT